MPLPTSPLISAREREYRLGRTELLALISAIMALTAVAIDLMLPAFDDIRDTFGLADGSADTGQIVTVYFLGLAVAQLFYGPLADRFGRKPILYVGICIYIAGAVLSAIAPTFGLLLLGRFVWGAGAAGTRVVAMAVVRDRFEGDAMAKAMSQIMVVFMLVPIVAPAVGSAIVSVVPWQGLFWLCVAWALTVLLWSFRLMEPLDPANRRPLHPGATYRGFVQVSRTPVTAGYTISTMFLQAVFTAYLATSEVIISDIFDRRDQFPLIFGAVAILFAITVFINGRAVDRFGIEPVVTAAYSVILSLCVLLIVFSVVGGGVPPIWLFMPVLGLILSAFMFLLPNLNSAAMTPVGDIAGTASALTGSVRLAGGAALGALISSQVTDSVTPFAVGVGAMCFCAAASVWIVRYRAADRTSSSQIA
ncbi:MAG: MFS transporter [Actinobacteria bacterium]|nr:MAG: MFS transporter [Actinomycetota bacterium]